LYEGKFVVGVGLPTVLLGVRVLIPNILPKIAPENPQATM
jgi:hypothetical protein